MLGEILKPSEWPQSVRERRYFGLSEVRASAKTLKISGHAAVFNKLSEDLGGFRETIRPGAFADTIKTSDVRALWNHDTNYVLARTKNGTLQLAEDEKGLAIEADVVDTPFNRGAIASIERGDVDQMSFGFMILPNGDTWRHQDGGVIRELIKVELFDVSPVTFPAYPQTDVQARSYFEAKIKSLSHTSTQIPTKTETLRQALIRKQKELNYGY